MPRQIIIRPFSGEMFQPFCLLTGAWILALYYTLKARESRFILASKAPDSGGGVVPLASFSRAESFFHPWKDSGDHNCLD